MSSAENPYYFDRIDADAVCDFFEKVLRHTVGQYAGLPFLLQPWQRRILRAIFGWKRKRDGLRRYRYAYIEIPRGAGKSTLASGIALYLLIADGEPGAKVYSAAVDRTQAEIVFEQASHFVQVNELLSQELEVLKREIRVRSDPGASYVALSADVSSKHGQMPHGIVFDELHTQPNRRLFDVLRTGMGKRAQPMMVMITTAGDDIRSICYEQYDYARQVRDGVIEDDQYFVFIAEAAPDDDWRAPATWYKANPSLGVTVTEEFYEGECKRAQQTPAAQNAFRQLYLNQWVNQAVRWLDLSVWDEGSTAVPDLAGRGCYIGVDLASVGDIAAAVKVFPPVEEGEPWWILPRFYVPAENLLNRAERNRAPYQRWVEQGHLIATEGNVIHYGRIESDILEDAKTYRLLGVGVDAWNAQQMAQNLTAAGLEVWEVKQTMTGMAGATKKLEMLVLARSIGHGGHPVLRWMVDNVAVVKDGNENIKPHKEKSRNKIDGVVATINALDVEIHQIGFLSVYERRGVLEI